MFFLAVSLGSSALDFHSPRPRVCSRAQVLVLPLPSAQNWVRVLRVEPIPICLSGHRVRPSAASAFIARFLLLELFSARESVGP
jgi:hypothetical protein